MLLAALFEGFCLLFIIERIYFKSKQSVRLILEIYGHLQVAEEIIHSPELNPALKEIFTEKRNYFNIGNFIPDFQYLIVRLSIFLVIKNILFGFQSYRRVTKKTNLEHRKNLDFMVNAFKCVDDSLRYVNKTQAVEKSGLIKKQIALLMGTVSHFLADRFIHYVIESIQAKMEYESEYHGEIPSHQQIEISFSYYWLKSKDKDWYDFSDNVRIPKSKKWWRRLFLVRDETLHSMIQQTELLTIGDSLSGSQINMALNNIISFGKHIRLFSVYRKIKDGDYIFDFDILKGSFYKKDNLIKEMEKKVLPRIVSILNTLYDYLVTDMPYFEKIEKIRLELKDIDANKPEVYDF